MLKLSLLNESNYTQSFTFDEIEFKVNFKLNNRDKCYYLSLFDADNTLLLSGVKIVKNTPLLSRFRRSNFPLGDLVAISSSSDDKITENSFVSNLNLFYLTGSEVSEILNG